MIITAALLRILITEVLVHSGPRGAFKCRRHKPKCQIDLVSGDNFRSRLVSDESQNSTNKTTTPLYSLSDAQMAFVERAGRIFLRLNG